jgi:hypothetical protein
MFLLTTNFLKMEDINASHRVNKYQVAQRGNWNCFIITLITINSVSCFCKMKRKSKTKNRKELNKVRLKCAFRHQIVGI